jgi:hypothetical protein
MAEIIRRDRLPSVPTPGLTICYSYLWHREKVDLKLSEGLKNRPCVIVLSHEPLAKLPGRFIADVVPVSHGKEEEAVEIPLAVKKRMGLDDQHSWIITTEINRFIWPGPDIRTVRQIWQPGGRIWHWGFMAHDIFRNVRERVLARRTDQTLHIVSRPGV